MALNRFAGNIAPMKSILRCLFVSICLAGVGNALAEENTATGIFDSRYRTLTVGIEGAQLAPPVIALNSVDHLKIGFDALGEDREYLRYSIYHCNADWRPSGLVDSEIFDGFNIADVEDYAFSRATTTHYVHYDITLPNKDFQFNISGNYLLKVYPEDNPDKTLLQVRFMVTEGVVGVGGTVSSRTDVDYNDRHQQLSLAVDLRKYPVRDVFNDLRVVVAQNSRLDNQVMVSHPSRVNGSKLEYEHIPALIFPACNEYRRMETVLMQYPGMGVEDVEFRYPYYHHFLTTAKPRFAGNYIYDQTQHGRFFVREYNSTDSDVEAGYSVVHFTLDLLPIPGKDVYIDAEFLNRRLDDSSKMIYDAEAGVYHREYLLKQGAYNFQYVAVPTDKGAGPKRPIFNNGITAPGSSSEIEGDYYQTVNEYFVAVYYRAPGERYDRLLGYSIILSGK